MASLIYRGTTPSFKFTLPDSFDLRDFQAIFLSFSKTATDNIFDKDITMAEVGDKYNIVIFTLTQEESLQLPEDGKVYYQLRWRVNGKAYASDIKSFTTGKTIKEGVI